MKNTMAAMVIAFGATACDTAFDPGYDIRSAWSHAEAAYVTGIPHADEDLVAYATLDDPHLVVLDASTGRLRWKRRLPIPAERGHFPSRATIVPWDDILIVSAWDMFALDRQSGAIRWSLALDDDYIAAGRMVLANGRLFTTGRRLYCVDPASGTVLWQSDLDGEQPFGPVAGDDHVYVGTRAPLDSTSGAPLGAGHAIALSAATGDILWKHAIPDASDANWRGGAIAPGRVVDDVFLIAGRNARVYALNRHSGEELWVYTGPLHYDAGIAVIGNTVVVANTDVEGLDLHTGIRKWHYRVGSSVIADITQSDRFAYVSVGRVFAFDADGGVRWADGGAGWGGPIYTTAVRAMDSMAYVGASDSFRALRLPGGSN